MTYSFDVFDTLITRNTAVPEGIFAVMQQRLMDLKYESIDCFVKNNFYELRIGAEQVARNTYCRNGIDDVTLEQIYSVFTDSCGLKEEDVITLQILERETELEHVQGIEENIEKVKELYAAGEKVLLISDMYLDSGTIRKMLVKVDPIFEKIPLYVSSEEKKNKWTSGIYRLIQEKEKLKYNEWIHTGDNEHSDYEVPRTLGITCKLYEFEELLPIEKEYLKSNENNVNAQLALGCARNVRIRKKRETAYRLGCGIGGEILYPYVKWILEESTKRGIQRLYFIARDGYVLKRLADVLIQENHYPIQTKYIYGSRIAWRITDREGEDYRKDMLEIYEHSYRNKIFCADDLATLWGISREELQEYLPYNLKDDKKIWTMPIVDLLMKKLLYAEDFVKMAKNKQKERRELLIQYLKQEIDVSDEAFAFVDLAGSGLTQECLAKTLRTYYGGSVKNFFFRMDEVRKDICDNYVFYPNFVPYYVLLEMMCRAPQGQTLGYKKTDEGKVIPVFSQTDEGAIIQHGVPDFIEGVLDFGKQNDRIQGAEWDSDGSIERIRFFLNYVYQTPDEQVLNYFADMPNMLTGREKSVTVYAPRLTDEELEKIYQSNGENMIDYYYQGSDISYSLQRCTEEQKQKIKQYKQFPRKLCCTSECTTAYDLLENNIIIYGAGKKGQLLYSQLTSPAIGGKNKYSANVILWVDRDYREYQRKGLMISNPEEIMNVEYDQIVIAIAKKETAEEVKNSLIARGISEGKIIWINPIPFCEEP